MFRFGVVLVEQGNLLDMPFAHERNRAIGYAHSFDQDVNEFPPKIGFVFANTEEEASRLGQIMAMNSPGKTYAVFEVKEIWKSAAAPAARSKVTDKGILPE